MAEPATEFTPEQELATTNLLEKFGELMVAFGAAQEAGLDAGAILVSALQQELESQGQELPPILRMLL